MLYAHGVQWRTTFQFKTTFFLVWFGKKTKSIFLVFSSFNAVSSSFIYYIKQRVFPSFFLSLYLPTSKGVDNQCICISNKVAKTHLLILCSITKLNEKLWKLNRFMARCMLVWKKIESPMQPLIFISRCIITIMYAHIEDENVSSSWMRVVVA